MYTAHKITVKTLISPKEQFFRRALLLLLALAFMSTWTGKVLGQQNFADLVEKVQPAVVNITTVQMIERSRQSGFPTLPKDMPFGDMMEKFRGKLEEDEEPIRRESAGSGFIIDAEGYVVTNHHVIGEADEITVILSSGEEYAATVVGSDALTDLALLRIEADEPLPFVKFGSSSNARIGEWVLAIGNPFGIGSSVSAGIISGRDREANGPYVDFIQTDTAINQGNSGGPLFNMKGEVVGINSMIITPNGGSVGMGFAIPSDAASRYLKQLREHGKVHRSWLGVTINNVTEDVAEILGLDNAEGVIISEVVDGAPSDVAGIAVGDIILSWDGVDVPDVRSLQKIVAATEINLNVPVKLWRDGTVLTLNILTREMPKAQEDSIRTGRRMQPPEEPEAPKSDILSGMELSNLTGEFRRRYNIDNDVKGVAVTRVKRNSEAERLGIRPGTVIESVNLKEVISVNTLLEKVDSALAMGSNKVLLRVLRNDVRNHVTLEINNEKDKEKNKDKNKDK